MNLHDNVSLLDPFTHTVQDGKEIKKYDFEKKENRGKVKIDETFCTLVTVSGKYLEKNTFQTVMRKSDTIRTIIRKYMFMNLL